LNPEFFKAPPSRTRSDLTQRLGAIMNPARTHPEEFSHMRHPTPTRESTKVDLDDPSPTKNVTLQIDISDEEDYESGSDEEESPPPIQSTRFHKMTTRAAKLTPAKTAGKAPES